MNNLREIKKPRLLHDESFTYMLSSDERTNADDPIHLTNFYDLPFGGFREPYEEYKVEVLSFVCGGGIPLATGYYIFVVENLDADGYFCSKKLTNKEIVLSKLPLNAVSDAYYQSDGGTIGVIQSVNTHFVSPPKFIASTAGTVKLDVKNENLTFLTFLAFFILNPIVPPSLW